MDCGIYLLNSCLKSSFKDENNNVIKGDKISVGEKIPFMVYSLPYADPNGSYKYCQLTDEGIPPEKWGEHYKVQHYIIFYLRISANQNLG